MQDVSLSEIISLHGRWRAREPALITAEASVDWQTFDLRTNQVANGFAASDLARGDRLGLVMNNGAAMGEMLVGALKAGLVVAPLNTTVSNDALEAMLRDAGVKAIATTAEHRHRIRAEAIKGACLLLVADDEQLHRGDWQDYGEWRDRQACSGPRQAPVRADICNIIYSSGTTGEPKGIAHSHGARLDWAHDLAHALRYRSGARLLVATGLYSNITWAGMLPTLMLGGTLVIRHGFDPLDVLQTIQRERITHMSLVPVQFQRLLQHPDFDAFDTSSVEAMMCCGAPLPLRVKEALFAKFACGVIELYGSTEGIVTTLAPEEAGNRMSSVGRPLPGEDIAILDDHDQRVAPGQAGEVVALSRFAMDAYWNRPEATAQAMWIDEQGRHWLRSGDIGRLDGDGFLYITDRKKDMIISGGQNVYPADIEAVLASHPDVQDCAVFGVPSDKWGETPQALVVLRNGSQLHAEVLHQWVNERLGRQQRVNALEVRSSLPRNANGKLLKRELRAPYWWSSTPSP